MSRGSGWKGGLGGLPHFCGALCRGHAQYSAFAPDPPAFAPGSSEVAVGLLGLFCVLLSIIFPSCTCMQLFLVPYSFFVFCCSKRDLSRCKHCSTAANGPRSQTYLIPPRDSTPLFLSGKGPKVSSSETSSCWTGATDPSLP